MIFLDLLLGGETKDVESCADNGFVGKDGFIMETKEVPNMESTAVDQELQNVKFLDNLFWEVIIFDSEQKLWNVK